MGHLHWHRPTETKFGDKYVVMHPADERYKEYVDGQKIELD